jgi:hypothetical protein
MNRSSDNLHSSESLTCSSNPIAKKRKHTSAVEDELSRKFSPYNPKSSEKVSTPVSRSLTSQVLSASSMLPSSSKTSKKNKESNDEELITVKILVLTFSESQNCGNVLSQKFDELLTRKSEEFDYHPIEKLTLNGHFNSLLELAKGRKFNYGTMNKGTKVDIQERYGSGSPMPWSELKRHYANKLNEGKSSGYLFLVLQEKINAVDLTTPPAKKKASQDPVDLSNEK